jgi:hypothetical protein
MLLLLLCGVMLLLLLLLLCGVMLLLLLLLCGVMLLLLPLLLQLLLPLGIVKFVQPIFPEVFRRDVHLSNAALKFPCQHSMLAEGPS